MTTEREEDKTNIEPAAPVERLVEQSRYRGRTPKHLLHSIISIPNLGINLEEILA